MSDDEDLAEMRRMRQSAVYQKQASQSGLQDRHQMAEIRKTVEKEQEAAAVSAALLPSVRKPRDDDEDVPAWQQPKPKASATAAPPPSSMSSLSSSHAEEEAAAMAAMGFGSFGAQKSVKPTKEQLNIKYKRPSGGDDNVRAWIITEFLLMMYMFLTSMTSIACVCGSCGAFCLLSRHRTMPPWSWVLKPRLVYLLLQSQVPRLLLLHPRLHLLLLLHQAAMPLLLPLPVGVTKMMMTTTTKWVRPFRLVLVGNTFHPAWKLRLPTLSIYLSGVK